MSQTLVLQLLTELERATTKQLVQLARSRYPELSLHKYIGDRLNKLRKWKIIDKDKDGSWYIREQTT